MTRFDTVDCVYAMIVLLLTATTAVLYLVVVPIVV